MSALCRHCLFWKRRAGDVGDCWHRGRAVGGRTTAEATCEAHAPKVIRVGSSEHAAPNGLPIDGYPRQQV